jgi:hypothetical protein
MDTPMGFLDRMKDSKGPVALSGDTSPSPRTTLSPMQGRLVEVVQSMGGEEVPPQMRMFLTAITKVVERGMFSDDDILGALRLVGPLVTYVMGEETPAGVAVEAPSFGPVPDELVQHDAEIEEALGEVMGPMFMEPFAPAAEVESDLPLAEQADQEDQA